MDEQDQHDRVVAAIRRTLPEFASRNEIELSEPVMDNLAHWVAQTVPSNLYRRICSSAIGAAPDEVVACACTGYCRAWLAIPDELRQ